MNLFQIRYQLLYNHLNPGFSAMYLSNDNTSTHISYTVKLNTNRIVRERQLGVVKPNVQVILKITFKILPTS